MRQRQPGRGGDSSGELESGDHRLPGHLGARVDVHRGARLLRERQRLVRRHRRSRGAYPLASEKIFNDWNQLMKFTCGPSQRAVRGS